MLTFFQAMSFSANDQKKKQEGHNHDKRDASISAIQTTQEERQESRDQQRHNRAKDGQVQGYNVYNQTEEMKESILSATKLAKREVLPTEKDTVQLDGAGALIEADQLGEANTKGDPIDKQVLDPTLLEKDAVANTQVGKFHLPYS